MIRIIKRLPADKVVVAIMFLLLQISGAIYLPYMTANIVNEGIVNGDILHLPARNIYDWYYDNELNWTSFEYLYISKNIIQYEQ